MLTIFIAIYGIFLIVCGITAVSLIGLKAKTALASGGLSGMMLLTVAWMMHEQIQSAQFFGLAITLMLFVVFCWRSAKTLFKIFELIPSQHEDLNGKGIAFLIISLMAVVSLFALILQFVHLIDHIVHS